MSVTWADPPVKLYISQLSMVPKRQVPFATALATPCEFSMSHFILTAEKYVETGKPVSARNWSWPPALISFSATSAVRRSSQTSALCRGLPVSRSQATVVSRWFVIPMAATSAALALTFFIASSIVAFTEARISSGSCSVQPGCGYICVNSCWLMAAGFPSRSKSIAREEVVPWSMASTYLGAISLPSTTRLAVLEQCLNFVANLRGSNRHTH
mmetsp:Transcript_65934/g.121617  ORF Transcript_65934/g.121617 Transcript_65934/m.121617 type:complete len:213 (-) Transcript_65934:54-692(-)